MSVDPCDSASKRPYWMSTRMPGQLQTVGPLGWYMVIPNNTFTVGPGPCCWRKKWGKHISIRIEPLLKHRQKSTCTKVPCCAKINMVHPIMGNCMKVETCHGSPWGQRCSVHSSVCLITDVGQLPSSWRTQISIVHGNWWFWPLHGQASVAEPGMGNKANHKRVSIHRHSYLSKMIHKI